MIYQCKFFFNSLDCSQDLNPEIDCVFACLSAATVRSNVTAEANPLGYRCKYFLTRNTSKS